MIFFYFGPLSKDELTINFDLEGAASFLSQVSLLLDGTKTVVHVNCVRLFRGHSKKMVIELRLNLLDRFEVKSGSLSLDLSLDALEYAVHQLTDYLDKGYFFPSEFWSFSRVDRKYDTQVLFGVLSA